VRDDGGGEVTGRGRVVEVGVRDDRREGFRGLSWAQPGRETRTPEGKGGHSGSFIPNKWSQGTEMRRTDGATIKTCYVR
jgi:hypothetical protein